MSAGVASEFVNNFSKTLDARRQLIKQYDPFSQEIEEDDDVNETHDARRRHGDGDESRRHHHRRHHSHHHSRHTHRHSHHHKHHHHHRRSYYYGSHSHSYIPGMEEQYQGRHWLRDTLTNALRTRRHFAAKAVEPLFNIQDGLRRLFSLSQSNMEGIFPPFTQQPATSGNATQAEEDRVSSPNTQAAPNSLSAAEVIDGIDSKTAEKIRQSAPQNLEFPDPKFLELLQKDSGAKADSNSGPAAETAAFGTNGA